MLGSELSECHFDNSATSKPPKEKDFYMPSPKKKLKKKLHCLGGQIAN